DVCLLHPQYIVNSTFVLNQCICFSNFTLSCPFLVLQNYVLLCIHVFLPGFYDLHLLTLSKLSACILINSVSQQQLDSLVT
uniref:Ovule protein n=1 Tax=Mesocestoides corti TaxID=53468 RepID=A0A5K3EIA4_MESCO